MSSSQFQLELKSHVKGSGFLGFGSHSSDMYIYQYYNEFHNDVQSSHLRQITWFDLELSPIIQIDYLSHLSPWAKMVFSNLGHDLTSPEVKNQYLMALDFFGDSLVTRVSMGGSLYYKAFLNNDTVKAINIEHFQEQSGWSFFGIFGSKSAYDYYEKQVSDTIKASMKAEIKAMGGNWAPPVTGFTKTPTGAYSFALKDIHQNVLDWDTYVKSIKDNLVPVEYEIIPMYQIFSDPVIRNNFMLVTQEYLKSKSKARV